MSGEKKLWRLSIPFRRFSGNQDLQPKARARRSGTRPPSVYLSDGSSTSDFIIVPEFDYPVQTHATLEESNPNAYLVSALPAATFPSPLSPNGVNGCPANLKPMRSQCSYPDEGSCDTSIVNTRRADDLTQRLDFAYEHIRSMSSASPLRDPLSSDPQMLRKQLGVPQHSVFNYPVHSSPDLPNPHASPPESTYTESPPATSLDISYAGTSQKTSLGINMNTDVYPSSPRRFQDSIQHAPSNSVVTTPILTEDPPSQCRILGTPWSTHIAHTSKPQPVNPNPSKLIKRRVEKATLPSSSPPTSRRQALTGALQKLGPNTPPTADAHRRQISLPQFRPPSPFKVDIALHHPWHDRRTDFNPSTEYRSGIVHDPNLRRRSGSTEVLASLAWIGIPHTANRRHHPASSSNFPDRFSIEIAVEDDSISDDVLVDRLERARKMDDPSEWGKDISPSRSSSSTHFWGDEYALSPMSSPPSSPPTSDQLAKPHFMPPHSSLISKDATSDSEDAAVWRAARKAILCTREIVRTEKKYQEALKMLLNAQTATPPPPSMSAYVSALVRVSEMLLKRFLEDPSAWGVSTAFVTCEDELEATMVAWCAVAGTFFTDENDPKSNSSTGKRRLRKSGPMPSSSPSATKRASISLSPQLPPMFSMIASSKIKGRTVEEYCSEHHLRIESEKQPSVVPLQKPERTNSRALIGQPPSRKLSVRDLAIQPIQRVMRYVLLYRDLLDCTPVTSPPRLLVERALEAATRIANHCDRAQRNPAFCHAS